VWGNSPYDYGIFPIKDTQAVLFMGNISVFYGEKPKRSAE
jgi:hypothetical protein